MLSRRLDEHAIWPPEVIQTARTRLEPRSFMRAEALFSLLNDQRLHEFTEGKTLTLESCARACLGGSPVAEATEGRDG